MGQRTNRRSELKEDPEGIYLENIGDLRMATDRAYQLFSGVLLLRGDIDSSRAHKGNGRPILQYCRRVLICFERFSGYASRILLRLRAHQNKTLGTEAQKFCDALDHLITGVVEAIETRIIPKIIDLRARVSSLGDEPEKLDRALFDTTRESIFCTASSLVEAADQIRRQLPKDWTMDAIMRSADPASTNGAASANRAAAIT